MSDVEVRNRLRRRISLRVNGMALLLPLIVSPLLVSMLCRAPIYRVAILALMTLTPLIVISQGILFIALRHSPKKLVFGSESVRLRFSTRSVVLDWEDVDGISGSRPLHISLKSGGRVTLNQIDPEIVKEIFSRVLSTREAGFWRGVDGL